MVPEFIGLEISVPVKDKHHNTPAQLLGKVESIRYLPSLNDKSGYCGKTYVVVLDRLAVPFSGKADEFVSRYDKFFERTVMEYLTENWFAEPISELKYLVFIPNDKGDDERSVKDFIEKDITINESQEFQFCAKAQMMIAAFKKKASDYLNEFRSKAKNEDLQAIAYRQWGVFGRGESYTNMPDIFRGIFQCDCEVNLALRAPRGGDTLTIPCDKNEAGLIRRAGKHFSGFALSSICTFGLDPWPFIVVSVENVAYTHENAKFYAIARIDGRFIVREIKEANDEKQYEMETLLVITEALSRNVA